MADKPKHKLALALRTYAEKVAADRLTTADGQGGISTHQKQPAKDVGESEVKRDQPADGAQMDAADVPATNPDRLTTADGQGGVSATAKQPTKDPGEGEVKQDQPVDGETRKAATLSERALRIRAAVSRANPNIAARIEKQAEAAPTATVAPKSAAPESEITLSSETLIKVARAVLATEEGAQFAYGMIEKQAGEAAARAQIQEAIQAADLYDHTEQVKQAAFEDFQEKAANVYESLVENGVTEEHADLILKQAAHIQESIDSLDHPLLKQAYMQGMDDAALMAAAEEAEGQEGMPGIDEALPMGGEELTEEEILALLEEMIATGQITEEDVMAAIAATEGAEETQ